MPSSFCRILIAAVFLLTCGLRQAAPCAEPPSTESNGAKNEQANGLRRSAEEIEFNRDIRPILSDACFHCHGPDSAKREAGLRLDTEAGAKGEIEGRRPIVPHSLDKSELYRRITSADPDERMPPESSGRKVTPEQVALLKRWIEQGAPWQPHWSLIPPKRPPFPQVRQPQWISNPIDAFVLSRLEHAGLPPSPPADRATLIRRVTLDLTGLPPTPSEVDAFLADERPDAYDRLVDQLLASSRYGERMAAAWLDAARYADTSGYQNDGERFMWRWRDWVIDAFNANMSFNQFTIEQLAGDQLPKPTLDQLIATGFNRNHRGNAEGGIIPEEYAVEYVVDRVETTGTVWLGLTVGCTRCHDHKYDPLTQREFYQLYAFFNSVPERGRAIKYGNSPPLAKTPTRDQQRELAEVDEQLSQAAANFDKLQPEIASSQAAWEKLLQSAENGAAQDSATIDWTIEHDLAVHLSLDQAEAKSATNGWRFVDGEATYVPGKLGTAVQLDGRSFVDAGDVADYTFYDKFTLAAWIYLDDAGDGLIISHTPDMAKQEGYSLAVEGGRLQLNLVKRWLDDALRVQTAAAVLKSGAWHHVAATYDGSRVAKGVQLYVDGRPEKLDVQLDELNQSFQTKQPVRVGGGGGPEGRLHARIDDVRIYEAVLDTAEVSALSETAPVAEIARAAAGARTAGQSTKLRAYFLTQAAPQPIRDAYTLLVSLRREREELEESFPTTMIMQDTPEPRQAFILNRGEYDKPTDRVSRDVPGCLPPFAEKFPRNRLGFSQWLVQPEHPLTARVAVNRFWQLYFGAGLVKTTEDFGSQGEPPSHPELLDYLATTFANGWDIKGLQRLIVTSSTYRQSSRAAATLVQRDPENRLLARGPRLRLSAEAIRDQALSAAGLLVEQIGGPSVKPYQPAGLWKDLTGSEYVPDHGQNLYRRSLYTFWKRTIAPPSMLTFDAAGRETCVVRQSRTNTPLQALTLMNDVTYVEAARQLAQRVMHHGCCSPDDRLIFAFRLVLARPPQTSELDILRRNFDHHLSRFRAEPAAAEELLTIGESPRDSKLDAAELAAYTAVANLILNLDEAVTKQ